MHVEGARPGDVLQVDLLEFARPEWGWTAIIPGFGLLADEFPDPWLRISRVEGDRVRFSDSVSLPLRPFSGTIGVALPEPGQHSIVPPSRFGGNLDVKHLNPGATLYLPVGVEGAHDPAHDVGQHRVIGLDGDLGGRLRLRHGESVARATDAPPTVAPARMTRKRAPLGALLHSCLILHASSLGTRVGWG